MLEVNSEVFLPVLFSNMKELLGSKYYLIFAGIFIECKFIVAQKEDLMMM
jgi:hypothetical protein